MGKLRLAAVNNTLSHTFVEWPGTIYFPRGKVLGGSPWACDTGDAAVYVETFPAQALLICE